MMDTTMDVDDGSSGRGAAAASDTTNFQITEQDVAKYLRTLPEFQGSNFDIEILSSTAPENQIDQFVSMMNQQTQQHLQTAPPVQYPSQAQQIASFTNRPLHHAPPPPVKGWVPPPEHKSVIYKVPPMPPQSGHYKMPQGVISANASPREVQNAMANMEKHTGQSSISPFFASNADDQSQQDQVTQRSTNIDSSERRSISAERKTNLNEVVYRKPRRPSTPTSTGGQQTTSRSHSASYHGSRISSGLRTQEKSAISLSNETQKNANKERFEQERSDGKEKPRHHQKKRDNYFTEEAYPSQRPRNKYYYYNGEKYRYEETKHGYDQRPGRYGMGYQAVQQPPPPPPIMHPSTMPPMQQQPFPVHPQQPHSYYYQPQFPINNFYRRKSRKSKTKSSKRGSMPLPTMWPMDGGLHQRPPLYPMQPSAAAAAAPIMMGGGVGYNTQQPQFMGTSMMPQYGPTPSMIPGRPYFCTVIPNRYF
ncbi:hypothetical protein ACOME3_005779 [Neoechinorhynchus agilis]